MTAPELLPMLLPLPALPWGKANSRLSRADSLGLIRHLDIRGGGGGCSARHGQPAGKGSLWWEPQPVKEMLGWPAPGRHASAAVLREAGLLGATSQVIPDISPDAPVSFTQADWAELGSF